MSVLRLIMPTSCTMKFQQSMQDFHGYSAGSKQHLSEITVNLAPNHRSPLHVTLSDVIIIVPLARFI
jgi:hypothetical protein